MDVRRMCTWGVLFGLAALPGFALANQEVIKLSGDSKNWAMQAGNMQNHRYSSLKQISKDNVKDLRVAWIERQVVRLAQKQAAGKVADRRSLMVVKVLDRDRFIAIIERHNVSASHAAGKGGVSGSGISRRWPCGVSSGVRKPAVAIDMPGILLNTIFATELGRPVYAEQRSSKGCVQ